MKLVMGFFVGLLSGISGVTGWNPVGPTMTKTRFTLGYKYSIEYLLLRYCVTGKQKRFTKLACKINIVNNYIES